MKNIVIRTPKLGTIATAVLMAPALLLMVWILREQLFYVLSGKLFGSEWCRYNYIGLSRVPQPIRYWYFVATIFTVVVICYIAAVRWLTARNSKLSYWVFAAITSFLCIVPIIIHTTPFYWMLLYIYNMGFTQMRIYGLLYGLGVYIIILGFLYWALRVPKEKDKPEEPAE